MQRQSLVTKAVLIAVVSYVLLLVGCTEPTPTPPPPATPTITTTPESVAGVTSTPTEPAPTVTATPTLEPQVEVTPTPAYTVTLRIGWLESPDSLRPFAEHPTNADMIFSLLYDRLIYHALDNTYAPALAKSWGSPDGGKTWTFSLQPDVKTHDGQPFTAEDVAFTLELYQEHPRFSYYGGQRPPIEKIEATGANSVTVTMNRPVGNIEALFHWLPLLPKRIWETVETTATTDIGGAKAIGSGPFTWKEYPPGQGITLAANRAYWMGAPKIDEVTFQTYPDADVLVAALKGGEVDLITEVPVHWIADLRSDANVQVVSGPQIRLHHLLFNVSNEAQSTGHPALKDPQVRLAIAHAIDKQQLIDLVLLGHGMPGLSVIPPALHQWFNQGIQDVMFDLDEARQTLESAGYSDTDNDGWREMPGGTESLDFRLFIPSDPATSTRAAEMLSNWLRQIGIKVTTQWLAPDALKAACCPAFDYDMMIWERDGGPDPGFFLSTLSTAEIDTGLNETGYSNPAYDALYELQAMAVDQVQRRQMVRELQQIAFNDRPCIVLYYDLAVQAFRKDRFQNWLFVPNGILSLADERSLLRVEPVPQ
jgi:peptide/nickel transport system substrate-binding protein